MEKYLSAFSSAATKIGNAAKKTSENYSDKLIPDEPAFTAALTTRIMDSLGGYSKSGISWQSKILTSSGPNTEEKIYGADLLGVLELDLPDFKIKKGFLAQAKRQEPGKKLSAKEWERLINQCTKMLGYTSESYVFIYSLNGVFIVPALSILGTQKVEDLHTLHPKRIQAFYKEHFMCFVGDSRLKHTEPYILEELRIPRMLSIVGSTTEVERDLFD